MQVMTTAKELGIGYSSLGELIRPDKVLQLNPAGVKFVREFAGVFNYNTVAIEAGFVIEKIREGVNGTQIELVIPTTDGRACRVPISVNSDYFQNG